MRDHRVQRGPPGGRKIGGRPDGQADGAHRRRAVSGQLRDAAAQMLAKASYRQAARRLASALAGVDGAATAASVLESRPSIAGDPKTRRTG
jgi:hypothetical protein